MATRDTEKEIARLKEVKKRLEEERALNAQLAQEKREQLKEELATLKLLYDERRKLEKQGKALSQSDEDYLKTLEEAVKPLTDINKKLKEQGTLIDANEKKQKRLLEESEKLFESTKRQLKQNYQVNKSLDDLGKALEKNKKLNQQFTEGFAAQEQQLDVINSILSKRGDITDKELANIQKFKKAINDNYKPIVDKSLYLFDANNPIRLFCWDIILNHSWFEYTMRVIIILSMVNLIIERPNIQDRNMLIALFYYDIVISF